MHDKPACSCGSSNSPWSAAVDSLSLSRMERVLEFIMVLVATGPPEREGTSSSLTTSKVSVSQL